MHAIEAWELHPALVHFPIAFLTGGVLLDLFAWKRARTDLTSWATNLLVAGVGTGWLAGLARFLAFFTIPAHTERAHQLLLIHLALNVIGLVVLSAIVFIRVRQPAAVMPTVRIIGALT